MLYSVEGRVATISLNRPERLNAIDRYMPGDIRRAVDEANRDDTIHAIVVTGSGRSFCSGYDLKDFSEGSKVRSFLFNLYTLIGVDFARKVAKDSVNQEMPWDPTVDYKLMKGFTDDFFSLWRSYKPTIAKVRGHCVAGGSDIALCCDLICMADDALIGYPPAR